ncbi:hypothetical protein [Rickettsia asembonensis]|nr:hypothetical protein [Rickettsia asembonensis]
MKSSFFVIARRHCWNDIKGWIPWSGHGIILIRHNTNVIKI